MFDVLFAIPAVFADVQPVRVVLFVFHCCVVAPLAVATRECEDDAVIFLGHGLKLLFGPGGSFLVVEQPLRQKVGGSDGKNPEKKHLLPGVNQRVYLYLPKPVNLSGLWRIFRKLSD